MDDSEEAKVTTATNALAAARDAVNRLPESYDGKDALARQLQGLQTSLNGKKMSRVNALVAAARTKINALTNASEEEMITQAAAALAKAKAAMATPSQITPLETSLATKKKERVKTLLATAKAAIEAIGSYNMGAVTDAAKKLAAAKAAFDKLPEAERAGITDTPAGLQTTLNQRSNAQMAPLGKAMYEAMEGPPDDGSKNALNNLERDAKYEENLSDTGRPSGLWLDMRQGAGTLADSEYDSPVIFTKIEDVKTVNDYQIAALAKWKVTDQTESRAEEGDRSGGLEKFHDRARVWNNRSPYTPLAADYFDGDLKPANAGTHTKEEKKLSLGTGVDKGIESLEFETASNKDWKTSDGEDGKIQVEGTYYGAPGDYYCDYTKASPASCRVSTGKGGRALTDAWYFVYDDGARINIPGLNYLYFGWWVRENVSDRMPRMATAFIGKEGNGIEPTSHGENMTGTATFEGPAVGVYAIHDPINQKGEAGEFEAVVRLEALFGDVSAVSNPVDLAGMTGTINRFKLNGGSEDPGWTVTLERNAWAANAKIDDRTNSTVWSINGVPGGTYGTWGGRMYDTTRNERSAGGSDGDGQPDVVLGTFYSEHGSTHRMVGAFAAKNITKNYDDDE